MSKHLLASAAVIGVLALPLASYATSHPPESANAGPSETRATEGEVRKVDRDAKKITIRHAELRHLNMPAMTMVFQVRHPSLLDRIREGDKVDFVVERADGQLILTHIETRQ